jgi:hypothetical protein
MLGLSNYYILGIMLSSLYELFSNNSVNKELLLISFLNEKTHRK